MATTIIQAVVAIGMSFLSKALQKKPKAPKPAFGEMQPTLSTRGSFVPLVLGRRRVSPIVAFDGDPKAEKVEQSGGKGGGSQVVGYRYKKAAIHLLALGPVDALLGIYENGKRIFGRREDPIYRDTTVSGSRFGIHDGSHFKIYWGEQTQPVNISGRFGAKTAAPGVCYIEWDRKELGSSPNWPQLEYVVQRKLPASALTGTSFLLRTTTPTAHHPQNDGLNPAHVIWNVLTSRFPYGAGVPVAALDLSTFEDLATLCETEHLPLNVLAGDGQTAADLMGNLMSEVGFVMPQVGRVLVPLPARVPSDAEISALPTLSDVELIDPDPEVSQQHGDTTPTRVVFTYPNQDLNYRPSDVAYDNDGPARNAQRQQAKAIDMPDVTDGVTATVIADRRFHEETTDGITYPIRVDRAGRNLQPGQLFAVNTIGVLRVANSKINWTGTDATVQAVFDQYGQYSRAVYPTTTSDDPDGPGGAVPAEPDLYFRPISYTHNGNPLVIVPRVRAHDRISGAYVWISASSGSGYFSVGNQDAYAAGGTINRPMTDAEGSVVDGFTVIDVGPTITPMNADITSALDLTGADAEWQTGRQMAVIGDELFHLKKVEAVSGGWRLRGMIRAQGGSVAAAHAVNAKVIIFTRSSLFNFSGGIITAGRTIYVKTQPFTAAGDLVDLADVTAVSVVVATP